jgi:hypothetical protein
MMALRSVLVVAAVASVVLAHIEHPPKLRAGGRDIEVTRCRSQNCTGSCAVVMEFKGDQCHASPGRFPHGEMLHCAAAPRKQCFRESFYDGANNAGCNGRLLYSAPRECDVCFEEIFGSGKFMKYSGCGTNAFTVSRGCEFGCHNCDFIHPVRENACDRLPGPMPFDIFVTNPTACDADITADHFFSPLCDGQPDFSHTVFDNQCYMMLQESVMFSCK